MAENIRSSDAPPPPPAPIPPDQGAAKVAASDIGRHDSKSEPAQSRLDKIKSTVQERSEQVRDFVRTAPENVQATADGLKEKTAEVTTKVARVGAALAIAVGVNAVNEAKLEAKLSPKVDASHQAGPQYREATPKDERRDLERKGEAAETIEDGISDYGEGRIRRQEEELAKPREERRHPH